MTRVAERQFTLMFLNTTVDALAVIAFGVGLATGLLNGNTNPLLTSDLTTITKPNGQVGGPNAGHSTTIGYTTAGKGQVSRVVTAWLISPRHRALLLDPHLKVVGIGLANGSGNLWATVDLLDM